MPGILFVLVGPSGAGKNTLMKRVQAHFPDLNQLATMTTRAPREGEQHGREHWFVSQAEFQNLIDTNALVEWQRVHLNDLYGTPRQTIDDAIRDSRDLIADIEFLGASKIHEAYAAHTVLIFVTPSRLEILAERIVRRGNIDAAALNDRLERARFEMTFAPHCDYVVLNDEIEPAVAQLRGIIENERQQSGTHHHIHTTLTALLQSDDRLLVDHTGKLPSFPLEKGDDDLYEVIKQRIEHSMALKIPLARSTDRRFDFGAPHQVSIHAAPPQIDLEFYYSFLLESTLTVPGWVWKSPDLLKLPVPV